VSNSPKRGAITYETEATFGVDTTTFTTFRLPLVGQVDCSGLKQAKMDTDRVTQRRQDGTQWILGTFKDSSFKTKFWLPGHGAATSGATSLNAFETLLGYVFGNSAVSAANGTTFTGGTASVPTTTASGTFSAGALCRGGSLADARGNGQWFAISTHSATTLNLLTAMDGAPTNGDVLYSAAMVYPSEAPTSTTIQSLRFLLQTANLMYELHGCVAIAASIGGLKAGDVPFIEVTWSCAWWRYSTTTFPSSVSTDTSQPAANAAGSLFVQDVGTVTRAKRTYRDLTIDYTLGVELLPGPGGVNQYQEIVGAVRTVDQIKVSWVEDADAATTSPVLPGYGTGTTAKHILATLNPTAQKSMGIYMPNVCVTNVAVQYADNNINRLKIEGMAYTGTTTTNDLTASAIRIGFA